MDFLKLVKLRRSVRSYLQEDVPQEDVDKVLEAARLAPSAKNIQPWKFIVVKNREKIEALAKACKNQSFVAEAPIVIVACGLPTNAHVGKYQTSQPVDVAIAFDHLTLAAAELGLGTCWLGAFYDEEVKEVVGIPDDINIVAVTPLGYPTRPLSIGGKNRKDKEDIIAFENW